MITLDPKQLAAKRLASGASIRNTAIPNAVQPNFYKQENNPTLQNPAIVPKKVADIRPQATISNKITNYGQLGNTQYTATDRPNTSKPNQSFTNQSGITNQLDTTLPGQTPNGMFDPNFIPKSEEEALNPAYDKYTSNKYLGNYYKSKGLNFDTSKFPTSFEEEGQQFLDKQKQQKSLMDQQIENAKAKTTQNLASNQAQAVTQLGPNREGITSAGNQMGLGQVQNQLASDASFQIKQLDNQEAQLNQQLQDNQRNFIAGREEQIRSQLSVIAGQKQKVIEAQNQQQERSMTLLKTLSDSGALANLSPEDQDFIAQGMPGVPPGVVQAMSMASTRSVMNEQQKAQFDRQTSTLNTLKGLVSEGMELTPSMILNLSQQTGLPADALLSFNQQAQGVMQNKSLDQAMKVGQIQELGNKLDQQARGIFNEAQQNVDYLSQLYKNGASPETIAAFKSAAKITDQNDPMYQADLNYKNAQTEYSKSQTAENYQKMQQAQLDYLDLSGQSSGGYVPTSSLAGITSELKNGKLQINCKTPMQCGEFVNRFWGLGAGSGTGMGSSAKSKEDLVRNRGVSTKDLTPENFYSTVKPGMAFVSKYGATDHTGIVTAIYPDGSFDTMEANIGDNNPNTPDAPRPKHRNIKDGGLVGFVYPPSGKAELQGGNKGSVANMSDEEILSAYEKAGKIFDTPSEARKAIAAAKNTGFVPKGDKSDKKADQTAFTQENMLRDEFTKNTQNFVKIRDSYNTIQAAAKDPSAAGDLSLIFSYMKILDPGSTVREGEFANAQNAGGIPTQIQNVWNKAQSGERLSPDQRKDFLGQAQKLYESQKIGYDRQVANTQKLAKSYSLDPKRVLYDFSGDNEVNDIKPPSTHGDFRSTIREAAETGSIRPTVIVKEMRDNPSTKDFVEQAMLNGGTPQEIIELYLKQQ